MSGLLTTLIVSLLWCVKVNTLGTLYEKDLDRACYNLVKWLSYYLYSFSFLSFCFYLGLTTQKGVRESVTSQVSHSHSHITGSHSVTSHDIT